MRASENEGEGFKRIGDKYTYTSRDVIGKGYSSVVYRGLNQTNGQSIALKLIDTKSMKGEVHKTLLKNEIEILNLLRNTQNVIKVHDIFSHKSQTCIVTQHCEGGDLAKIIKTRKLLPQQEATHILKQIINGYKGISRSGVVHRDLKPANIFFSEGAVKIADFGFAIKSVDLKKGSTYNVGSPVYMPLEALNDNIYSFKSDVWAIGVIFYEMLTGKTPWRAKTEADLKRQIRAVSIKSVIPAHISRLATQFLLRALHMSPNQRMSTDQMSTFFDQGMETTSQHFTPPINQRTNSLFRTRAVSQDRDERTDLLPIGKNTVTAPKSFRKSTRLGELFHGGLDKMPEPAKGHVILQKINSKQPKLGNLARTVAGMGEWIPDNKKTSNQLLSQIHFCRFCFKLLERMQDVNLGSDEIRDCIGLLIGGKMHELKELSVLTARYAALFRRTKEFQKISQILEQYTLKYAGVSKWQGTERYQQALKQADNILTLEITNLHDSIEGNGVQGREQQVILLDYLITLKQLLLLNSNHDLQYFHRKSKIDVIVQGRPSKNITSDHLEAITHKLRLFKIIS